MTAPRRRFPRPAPPLPLVVAVLVAATASAAWAPTARAADDDDDDVASLLERGVELRREHRNEEALELFERAARLAPSPRTLAQVALAEQALGRWVEAARDFDAALSSGNDPWIAKNLEALVDAQSIVARHVAWLSVRVDAPNAEVLLDGEPLPQGAEMRIASGPRVLEVRAAGRVPDIRRVEIEATQHVRLTVSLATLAPAATPPGASPAPPATPFVVPASTSPAPEARPIVPLVLGAAGVLAVGVGTYFGVRTFSDKSERDAQCVGGCQPGAVAADQDARSSATLSTAAFVAGGVLLAGAGIWWWVEQSESHGDRAALQVAPTLGPGAAGLVVRGAL